MTKDTQTLTNAQSFLRECRRQRKNRFGLVVHFSALERMFQESSYRRAAASAVQPLIRNHGARTFMLENGDMIIITGPATVATIDACLGHAREALAASDVVAQLTPSPGASDRFVSWYPLDDYYETFERMIEALKAVDADEAALAPPPPPAASAAPTAAHKTAGPQPLTGSQPAAKAKSANLGAPKTGGPKLVRLPSDEEDSDPAMPRRIMDLDMFKTLIFNLMGAEIDGMMVRSEVMARAPGMPAAPVMTHHHIPFSKIIDTWFGSADLEIDPWFQGYINDLVADRLLGSLPSLAADASLASSLNATTRTLLSPTFERFDRSLGDIPRKRIIFELTAFDAMSDPTRFRAAVDKVRARGFRVQLSGVDSRAFTWLAPEAFDVSFIKLSASHEAYESWLAPKKGAGAAFRAAVKKFGTERVIVTNCDKENWVAAAQKLGLYLFA